MEPIKDLKSYVPTDDFFGAPYIDEDVELDTPVPHRMIHGGFEGTDTRFRFHFPSEGYQGRMYNPLSGANGGHRGLLRIADGRSDRWPVVLRPARRLHGAVEPGAYRRRARPQGWRGPDHLRVAGQRRGGPVLQVRGGAGLRRGAAPFVCLRGQRRGPPLPAVPGLRPGRVGRGAAVHGRRGRWRARRLPAPPYRRPALLLDVQRAAGTGRQDQRRHRRHWRRAAAGTPLPASTPTSARSWQRSTAWAIRVATSS